MTNQATVPHGATATDPSGGSISSLVGYALSTLLVVVAVTGVALTVARDDPSASGVPGDRAAAATAASYAAQAQAQAGIDTAASFAAAAAEQQLVTGIDPGTDVLATVGGTPLSGLQGDAPVGTASARVTTIGPSPLHGLQGDAVDIASVQVTAIGPNPLHGLQGDAPVGTASAQVTTIGPSPMHGLQGDAPVVGASPSVAAGSGSDPLWVSRHR